MLEIAFDIARAQRHRRASRSRTEEITLDAQEPQQTFIVEDSTPTRNWLKSLLTTTYPGTATATAATLAEASAWLAEQHHEAKPLCLVDIGLPDGSGIDFIRALVNKLPEARPVVMTLFDDDQHLMAAMAAGAQGYLLKDEEPVEIVRRLDAMERGDTPISPAMATKILSHFRVSARFFSEKNAITEPLTTRESDVLALVGRGLKVAEAAESLGLSPMTVSGYVKNIYRKLDIGTRAEAAAEAIRRGLA